MGLLTIDNVQYYVERAGSGPPLLLLHGFTGSSASWASHVAAWRDRFTTIAVDLLGHGQTDAPADPARYRMERTVADLAGLLDRLGVNRAHLLGYSMGGRVALHFAAAYPERVGALVLESASPGLATAPERAARVAADEELAAFIEREGVPAFVDRWEQLPLWASQANLPNPTRAVLRAARLQNRAPGLANSLRSLGTGVQEPLHDRLAGLRMPVLLIAGALDAKFCALAGEMDAALPDARLVIMPDAGHTVHLEQPAAFNRLVVAFLDAYESLLSFSHKGETIQCR